MPDGGVLRDLGAILLLRLLSSPSILSGDLSVVKWRDSRCICSAPVRAITERSRRLTSVIFQCLVGQLFFMTSESCHNHRHQQELGPTAYT
jgi:hypothetical protein